MSSPVINIRTCAVCGGTAFRQLLTLPFADYVKNRSKFYDLASLMLSGHEPMGYAACGICGFIFANPTTDQALEVATYNSAKASQAQDAVALRSDPDIHALYQTHHKWVDINPFIIALGFHFKRFQRPRNAGEKRLRLLDIGCGNGHALEISRIFGIEATGCEIDLARLKMCHDKGLNAVAPHEVCGSFDIIFSCNVIEHVYDLKNYLSMVSEKLALGGVFVFNGLEKSVIDIELRKKKFKLLHPVEHRNIFTRGSLERALATHSLRLVTRGELSTVMRQVRSKAPLYLGYWLRAGFVPSNGVFSAIARRV